MFLTSSLRKILGIETRLEKEIRKLHESPMKVLSVEKTSDGKQVVITHSGKGGDVSTAVYLKPSCIRH